MSNIYNYFVNPKIISYISSEYIDSKKIDASNPATLNNVQIAVKKVLDDTYNLLDKSKISKNNVNDAIEKFVNVSMKRLNLQPRQRNIAAPVNMRMPVQHSTNTRMGFNDNESIDDKYNKYMQSYRDFGQQQTRPEIPDFLQSKSTNPKRMIDEQMKNNNSPLDTFKGTATRKNTQVYNNSSSENNIEDYGGSSNFSFFNDTPEINSAFDEAFYNTGIDPASINDSLDESVEVRLKKMEAERGSLKVPEKQVNNIEELFKNDNEFKKHLGDTQQPQHQQPQHQDRNMQDRNMQDRNQNIYNQERNPNIYNQERNPNQEIIMKFMAKEKQYQEHIQSLYGKVGKYEEYLKTLMNKYNELKSNNANASVNIIEEKKRELLRLSEEVQQKINRLEALQNE